MPDTKGFYKYFEFIKEVMKIATDCWASGEGKFEGKVSNDKGIDKVGLMVHPAKGFPRKMRTTNEPTLSNLN